MMPAAFWIAALTLLAATAAALWRPLPRARRARLWGAASIAALFAGALGLYYANSADYRRALLIGELARDLRELAEADIARLEAELAADPARGETRLDLAARYASLGRYEQAAGAYDAAVAGGAELGTEDMIAYAETLLALARDLDTAAALLDAALARAPDNRAALWRAGELALERGRPARAVALWTRLDALLPPDAARLREELRAGIDNARRRAAASAPDGGGMNGNAGGDLADSADDGMNYGAGMAGNADGDMGRGARGGMADSADGGANGNGAAEGGAALLVEVALAPALRAQLAPADAVFVYVRAAAGPPVPLAVKRLKGHALPAEVRLDAGDAMLPAMSMDAFERYMVTARVAKSGGAKPAAGDLIGVAGPLDARASSRVRVVIDEVFQ